MEPKSSTAHREPTRAPTEEPSRVESGLQTLGTVEEDPVADPRPLKTVSGFLGAFTGPATSALGRQVWMAKLPWSTGKTSGIAGRYRLARDCQRRTASGSRG